MDTLRRGFAVQSPVSTQGWYMAHGDVGFCGPLRNRWECLFLPWNDCPTRDALERLEREGGAAAGEGLKSGGDAQKSAAATLLGPSGVFSGRGAVFWKDGSVEAQLCDKGAAGHDRCPPYSTREDGHAFAFAEVVPGEPWDSARRLALLHRALWHRPAWRLRRAVSEELRAFYKRAGPEHRAAARTGACAFVYVRHGDKLYDRWLELHKTRSFAVDLPQSARPRGFEGGDHVGDESRRRRGHDGGDSVETSRGRDADISWETSRGDAAAGDVEIPSRSADAAGTPASSTRASWS